MWDFAKTISSARRVQAVLVAWLPPILLATYAFLVVVAPTIDRTGPVSAFRQAADRLGVNAFLFSSILALTLAALAYMLRRPLYRLLEGYSWPNGLREWRVERAHLPQRRWLDTLLKTQAAEHHAKGAAAELEQARGRVESSHVCEFETNAELANQRVSKWRAKLEEVDNFRHRRGRQRAVLGSVRRWHRPWLTFREPKATDGRWELPYPEEQYLLPTKVGNAFRRIETYGKTRFGLDSQILWHELYSEAPESLRTELDDCEFQADTFLAAFYSSLVFTVTALGALVYAIIDIGELSRSLLLAVLAGIGLVAGSHRGLLGAIREWGAALRALVNTSREALRRRYGLRVPTSIDEEKQMWSDLTSFIWYSSPQAAAKLDEWRSHPDSEQHTCVHTHADTTQSHREERQKD